MAGDMNWSVIRTAPHPHRVVMLMTMTVRLILMMGMMMMVMVSLLLVLCLARAPWLVAMMSAPMIPMSTRTGHVFF